MMSPDGLAMLNGYIGLIEIGSLYMRPQLNSERQKENYVRLLCHTGLDWRMLMPDLFQALRAVVAFSQAALVWYDDELRGWDGFSEWRFPGEQEVNHLLATEFYQKCRMRELFVTGNQLLQLPAICRPEQWLRVSRQEYMAHEFYQRVVRPSQIHHNLNLRVTVRDGMLGILTINRPMGEPDYSRAEIQVLERLLPFLGHALNQPETDHGNIWTDAEQGLILFDCGGVRYMDQTAEKLVDSALERRYKTRRQWNTQYRYPWLTAILKKLADRLEAIRMGEPAAEPARIKQSNRWGQFEFRGRWLEAARPGESRLFAADLYRQTPLPLKLALGLSRLPLSLRESQVALAIALGDTHAKAAGKLHISERTVIGHVQNVYDKLAVSNRAELLAALFNQPF